MLRPVEFPSSALVPHGNQSDPFRTQVRSCLCFTQNSPVGPILEQKPMFAQRPSKPLPRGSDALVLVTFPATSLNQPSHEPFQHLQNTEALTTLKHSQNSLPRNEFFPWDQSLECYYPQDVSLGLFPYHCQLSSITVSEKGLLGTPYLKQCPSSSSYSVPGIS